MKIKWIMAIAVSGILLTNGAALAPAANWTPSTRDGVRAGDMGLFRSVPGDGDPFGYLWIATNMGRSCSGLGYCSHWLNDNEWASFDTAVDIDQFSALEVRFSQNKTFFRIYVQYADGTWERLIEGFGMAENTFHTARMGFRIRNGRVRTIRITVDDFPDSVGDADPGETGGVLIDFIKIYNWSSTLFLEDFN